MIKYNKVLCDIIECTEYESKSIMSSALSDSNGNVLFEDSFGISYYDGKPIQEKVTFIRIEEPLYLYIPEKQFNFITKFLINFHSKFHHGITLDNKRFYDTSPNKIGDIYVEVINND